MRKFFYFTCFNFVSAFVTDDGFLFKDFSVGIQTHSYVEPGLIEITDKMLNVRAGIGFLPFSDMLVTSNAMVAAGTSGFYRGSLFNLVTNIVTPLTQDTDNVLGDVSAAIEYLSRHNWGYYRFRGGVGYYFLDNILFPPSGYSRLQYYIYTIVGLSLAIDYRLLVFQFSTDYEYILNAGHVSTTTRLGFGSDLEFSGQSGYGFLNTLTISFPHDYYRINLDFSYRLWRVSDSEPVFVNVTAVNNGRITNTVSQFIEPKNFTTQFTISVGLQF